MNVFVILCPMFQTTSLDLKFVIQLCSILERVGVIKECICTNVYNNIWLIVLTNVPYTIFGLKHCIIFSNLYYYEFASLQNLEYND